MPPPTSDPTPWATPAWPSASWGLSLVFGIGLCALVGAGQGWLGVAGTPLFVCGASSAFLGFLAFVLGVAGLFGKGHSRAAAIAGLLLGLGGVCLFLGVLSAISQGG